MYTADFCLVGMMKDMLNPLSKSFNYFVKQRIDEIEHSSLVTEYINNMDSAAYVEQSQK